LHVHWPVEASGFRLEAARQMDGEWTPVGGEVAVDQGDNCLTVEEQTEALFYRLVT
jgi:hypothetical protein